MTVTYFPFICHEAEEEGKKEKTEKTKQYALRKSASAGTRRQCSYSDFISLLEVVGVKSQQAIQHGAAGRPSRPRERVH